MRAVRGRGFGAQEVGWGGVQKYIERSTAFSVDFSAEFSMGNSLSFFLTEFFIAFSTEFSAEFPMEVPTVFFLRDLLSHQAVPDRGVSVEPRLKQLEHLVVQLPPLDRGWSRRVPPDAAFVRQSIHH